VTHPVTHERPARGSARLPGKLPTRLPERLARELPGEAAMRCERNALVTTMESLTDEEFERGRTLCAGWAPRDVLAHVMGVDEQLGVYLRAAGRVSRGNARVVSGARRASRQQLLARARQWADRPGIRGRLLAFPTLGDLCMHHQDVLRGLGRARELPEYASAACLREGALLGAARRLQVRVVPTDGGRPLGRGREVRGTREALGLWLAGRQGLEAELAFG
jgi:uncharacterized protein (TIGR03083 family)